VKFRFCLFVVTEPVVIKEVSTIQAAESSAISFSLTYGRKRKQAKTLEFSKLQCYLCQQKEAMNIYSI